MEDIVKQRTMLILPLWNSKESLGKTIYCVFDSVFCIWNQNIYLLVKTVRVINTHLGEIFRYKWVLRLSHWTSGMQVLLCNNFWLPSDCLLSLKILIFFSVNFMILSLHLENFFKKFSLTVPVCCLHLCFLFSTIMSQFPARHLKVQTVLELNDKTYIELQARKTNSFCMFYNLT